MSRLTVHRESWTVVLLLHYYNRQVKNTFSPTMASEKMEMEDTDSTLMDKGKKPPAYRPPNKFEKVFQPCLAEIVGTMFFVFIGCVSVVENVPAAGRVQPALVHGLAVAVMVAVMDNIRLFSFLFCSFCNKNKFAFKRTYTKYGNAALYLFTIS